jgi:acetyl-CoA carboxylase biotin carboxyl carrier protein
MDVKQIDQIAQMMENHGLSRVRIEEKDGSAMEIERPSEPSSSSVTDSVVSAPLDASADREDGSEEELVDGSHIDMSQTTAVLAPMVGVFYAAPSPGVAPFVEVGSQVHKGDTLCVIEAMKLMNEVTADCDGEIIDICAEDGELVEYGACLMKIY